MAPVDAAREVAQFLKNQGIPYAVIGGLAVQIWGEPRTTRDVDIVLSISAEQMDSFLNAALARFAARIGNAADFARRNRVLLLAASDGTPVDIAFGIRGYEEKAIERAVREAQA